MIPLTSYSTLGVSEQRPGNLGQTASEKVILAWKDSGNYWLWRLSYAILLIILYFTTLIVNLKSFWDIWEYKEIHFT